MDPHQESPVVDTPTSGLSGVEERVARGVVARHRARLDWMLRVPDWAELCAAGVEALGLPGQRQGIGLQAALLALPLESKHQLVQWVIEHRRHHVPTAIGRRICRMFGLELFEGLDFDELLSGRQWQRLREAVRFRLGQEHRRYKHAQQLLFTGHFHLVDQVVTQTVFRPFHRADCAQEGALGLLAAIDHVDESTGSLAAYAVTWIRRHVRNYLLRQRLPVQAPTNLIAGAVALRRAVDENLIAETDPDGTRRLQVLLLECLRHPAVTLDEPLDSGQGTVADTMPDPAADGPAESAAQAELRDLVGRGLAALTLKQREVLVHRFGLGGAVASSLSDIARAAGISHQQAGMRERRALKRLQAALEPLAAEWFGSSLVAGGAPTDGRDAGRLDPPRDRRMIAVPAFGSAPR